MQQPSIIAQLLRGAGAALTVQMVSAGVLYSAQVLLARWMGTAAYGIYEYATTISILGAFVAGFGLPTVVLRFIPTYTAKGDWAHLRGLLKSSWQQTLIVSLLTSLGGTVILLGLNALQSLGAYTIPIGISIWTIPIAALINLQKETIRAFRQIILSYAPSMIMQPLLLTSMAAVWQLHQELTSTIAIVLFLFASVLALTLQWLMFQQHLDVKIRNAKPAYAVGLWWRVALPLILLGGSHIVLSQMDTLMIGAFLDAEQVGIYSAAAKTSAWVPFILLAVNAVAAPLIASLYAQGDRQGLQQLVSTIAQWMFYPALVTGVGLAVLAEPILQLFGSDFIAARGALVVLILGQLVNVGAGSVGYLMTMTGHQMQSLWVMSISALVNAILNVIGIQVWGIVGAAIATAFSMALWNVWLYVLVVRQLGVRPSILDALRYR
ncbi:MAG: flippase [Cyanobacteria bacterium J06626_18]